jgi:predicted Zn-dependent protease
MNRIIFALALCAAPLLATDANADRLQLSEARCVNPHLSPQDRLAACQSYASDGTVGTDKRNTQYALAHAYRLTGDYADAEKTIGALIAGQPQWINGYLERSTIYAEDGKYDLAMADIATLASLNGEPALVSMQRCWVRGVAAKELDAGLSDCNDALKAYPASAAVFMARALVNYKRGDTAAAAADATSALLDKPKLAGAFYLRGIAKGPAGADDIASAKDYEPYIGDEFAGYGVKP